MFLLIRAFELVKLFSHLSHLYRTLILYFEILKLSVLEFVLKNAAKTDRVALKMAILLEQLLEREKIEKLCLRNVMYRLNSLRACGMFM